MKPVAITLLCLASFLGSIALAQSNSNRASIDDGAATAAKPSAAKLHHLRGTVGPDGKTFTTGKDHKNWRVMNPEALKGHEGHHRMLSASVNPDNNSIQVVSVIGYDRLKTKNDDVDLARNQSR